MCMPPELGCREFHACLCFQQPIGVRDVFLLLCSMLAWVALSCSCLLCVLAHAQMAVPQQLRSRVEPLVHRRRWPKPALVLASPAAPPLLLPPLLPWAREASSLMPLC